MSERKMLNKKLATKSSDRKASVSDIRADYAEKFGFSMPDASVFKTQKGLTPEVIKQISNSKAEPGWMLDFRLKAYDAFVKKSVPTWGADLSKIDFDNIYYYLKPTDNEKKNWEDVPESIKNTFEKLGVPQAEREFLAGVKAQYDSEVAYSSLRSELEEQGIIFMSTDAALKKYPELFKEYFGTVVPFADNKFAALNSAAWSGGSFVYIPKGVYVKRPLQAYFRINAKNMGQFERTLIIADEGSFAHYVEGCFTKGHKITTPSGRKNIEDIKVGDYVLTHKGNYKRVYHTQVRNYTGNLYRVRTSGNPDELIEVTEDHPFYASRRKTEHEKNNVFPLEWYPIKHLKKNDYLTMPVLKATQDCEVRIFKVSYKNKTTEVTVPLTPDFFRLIGYYLAEGSVDDRGDLNFSFNIKEGEYVEDIKNIVYQLFNCVNFYESTYKDRNGRDLRVCDARIARLFKEFGTHCELKHIPEWVMTAPAEAQRNLVIGYYRGDGNYYRKLNKYGLKELFRVNTVSEELAYQVRDILLRLGVVAFINKRNRSKEGRRAMYTIGIGGHQMLAFGNIVGNKVVERIGSHKRASRFHVDGNFGYMPVETLTKRYVTNVPVYNFSVSEDESYVVNGFAVHNCSAPVYTSDSLHAAVVEVIVKPGARMRYTTIQNWSNDVYNLVTKRARVEKNGIMEWVDGNIGAKVTMKYPSCYLVGEGARGEVLSLAYASSGMHQDAGAKMMHLAPNTSSRIISKSVSAKGGRTSYRGLVQISPMAKNSKSHVECDALILDPKSASDTFPVMRIDESSAQVEHEASVSKIGEEQLFYLESRGLTDQEARSLIISGFVEPIVKELPMEYAVELNRLIEMEMEGSVG